jgi:hypothetical protein
VVVWIFVFSVVCHDTPLLSCTFMCTTFIVCTTLMIHILRLMSHTFCYLYIAYRCQFCDYYCITCRPVVQNMHLANLYYKQGPFPWLLWVFSVFSLSLISCFAYQKRTIVVFVQQIKRKIHTTLTVSHHESLASIVNNLTISMCLLGCTLRVCGVVDRLGIRVAVSPDRRERSTHITTR